MARTNITVQDIVIAGLAPSYSTGDQPNGHDFTNDGRILLHVKNSGGSPCVVTALTPRKVSGVDISDPTVSIPATTGDRMIGPFDPATFNQADGRVYIDLSTDTGVTLAAIKLPNP